MYPKSKLKTAKGNKNLNSINFCTKNVINFKKSPKNLRKYHESKKYRKSNKVTIM